MSQLNNFEEWIEIAVEYNDDGGTARYAWCEEQFGKNIARWRNCGVVSDGRVLYKFKNEADAVLFALRWAGS